MVPSMGYPPLKKALFGAWHWSTEIKQSQKAAINVPTDQGQDVVPILKVPVRDKRQQWRKIWYSWHAYIPTCLRH
jgi:hypothetical protein